MPTYKTPDVYVEEISLFPPSVAQVETAIPAFIGYTEKATKVVDADLKLVPEKVTSLLEYHELFGYGPPVTPTVELDDNNNVTSVNLDNTEQYYLYDSLRLFFDNGGGKCYIISVGFYGEMPVYGDEVSGILGGLRKLAKEDEPTMIVCPDAVLLSGDGLYQFQQQALKQCNTLQDRVVICDLKNSGGAKSDVDKMEEDIQKFRDKVGINYLKYGAAYAPWLKTTYNKNVAARDITFERGGAPIALENLTNDSAIKYFIKNQYNDAVAGVNGIKVDLDKDPAQYNVFDNLIDAPNTTLAEQYGALKDAANGVDYTADTALGQELQDLYTFLQDMTHGVVHSFRNSLDDPAPDFNLRKDLDLLATTTLKEAFKSLIIHHNALEANSDIGGGSGFEILDTTATNFTQSVTALNSIDAGGTAISDSDTDAAINARYAAAVADTPEKVNLAIAAAAGAFGSIHSAITELVASAENYEATFDSNLADIFSTYKNILNKINETLSLTPPSGAIAGVYAMTDNLRGVWKAPANVSISSVIGPVVKIDNATQEDMNVDVNAGKSVNAIRAFTGKGPLVWGARTLAGNDNEWRYVPVRRFFNMVEESVKKSTYWAVFETNDANTWIRVKSMIENYLNLLWRDGALAGAKPEHAYFVKIGLGVTMTALDILEGRMNVEIGMAAVRPAEFIILKFSHKMQES